MKRTSGQNQRMFGLFAKHNIDKDGRAQLASDYSDGRTTSTSQLTFWEAQSLISALEKYTGIETDAEKTDKMRKRIISMGHEMGWELPGGMADMARIEAWTLKYGYLHKPLNEYTKKELPTLVTQFEGAYNHFLTGLKS